MVTSSSNSSVSRHSCLIFCSMSSQLCPLPELLCMTGGATSPACKVDLLAGAHVCRQADGGSAVRADQFGEQTYIKYGKGTGGMKDILTSAEQVALWINTFGMCSHFDIDLEHMYNETEDDEKPHVGQYGEEQNRHKEEGKRRRQLDKANQRKIYPYPINKQYPSVHNICNCQMECPTHKTFRMHW